MYATVYVGIDGVVFVGDGLYHFAWFLRGGSIVEVDERTLIYLAAEYGEVLADGC